MRRAAFLFPGGRLSRFRLSGCIAVVVALALSGCGFGITGTNGGGGNGKGGWVQQTTPTLNDLLAVSFADTLHGWAVGAITLLHTSDGGKTWINQVGQVGALTQWNGASATDSSHCWIVGGDGFVRWTENGGTSWSAVQPSPSGSATFNAVQFLDHLRGWVCGRKSNGVGVILYTINGGLSWSEGNYTGLKEVQAISFTTPSTGVACGVLGQIYYTSDGGRTWTAGTSPTTQALFAIASAPASAGQFGLAGGIAGVGAALVTSDAGRTWTRGQPLALGMDVRGASMVDFNSAFIAGWSSRAEIAASIDGGRTWISQSPTWSHPLNAIDMVDARHGWVVGDLGAIFTTRTGGN